jgi:hypothetical protein
MLEVVAKHKQTLDVFRRSLPRGSSLSNLAWEFHYGMRTGESSWISSAQSAAISLSDAFGEIGFLKGLR